MRRLCCLLFAVLIAAPEAASAPAPLPRRVPRPVRKSEAELISEIKEQLAARGVTQWRFGADLRYRNPVMTFELGTGQLANIITIEVVNGDLAAVLPNALVQIDEFRGLDIR